MAHQPTNNRRSLAVPDPQISKPTSDLTGKAKRHPKSATSAATTSAVYNLTNHFSKLHPKPKPTKTQNPNPQPHKVVDTHLQVKQLAKSAHFEKPSGSTTSTTTTHKVIGKQGKRVFLESEKKALVVVEDDEDDAAKVKKLEREIRQEEERRRNNGVMKLQRRSFCDVQVELANFLVTNCAKVASADMPPLMQIHAVGFARNTKDSLEKFTSKSLALSLKKEFDGVYGPAWHCIVGTSFGSFVTHSVGGFLYFSLDQKLYILLFKTTVQKAN